jgi:hypothetical protein
MLMPAAATGIAGRSLGALLAARYDHANTVAGLAGLSGKTARPAPRRLSAYSTKAAVLGGLEDLFTCAGA